MLVPRALWLLTWLRLKGSIRRALFSGSTRKTIATVVGGIAIALWLLNLAFRGLNRAATSFEVVREAGPALLGLLCLMPLAFGGASRMLAFAPAEVDQLFPAPFSRRQLIAYRMLKVSLGSLFTGVFYTLIFGGASVSWGVSFFAACLAWIFAGLFTMTFALVEAMLGQRARLLRLLPQAVLVIALAAAAWQVIGAAIAENPAERARLMLRSPVLGILALPFRPFIMLFTAQSWAREVPLWLAVCAGQVGLLAAVTLRLDTAWLDTSIAATNARAERLEQRRKGGRRTGRGPGGRLSGLIPGLHFLGPSRAIIRRHLHAAPSTLLVPLGVIAGLIGVVAVIRYATSGQHYAEVVVRLATTMGGMVLLFLPMSVRCDFRGDLDHLETLKTLPLSPAAIVRAELALPTALLVITAWEVLALAAYFGPSGAIYPAVAIIIPPAAVLLMAVENALFLFAPTRQGPAQAAALQVTGKRIITFTAKAIVLALCAGLGLGAAFLARALGGPVLVMGLAAAAVLTALAIASVWVVSVLYRRFDVAVDMPD